MFAKHGSIINMSSTTDNKARIEWIDCAKGFGILLVIMSHCVDSGLGSVLRGMIFSFHMPLFFALSSITYKCSVNYEEFKKSYEKQQCIC